MKNLQKLQGLVNTASAAHTAPMPPLTNPGAGLIAEGMRPLDGKGNALAYDRGKHGAAPPDEQPRGLGGKRR